MAEEKKPLKKPRGKARLLEGKCIACGARCESACPVDAVVMNEAGEPEIIPEKCIGCIKCVKVCPAQAIEMLFTPEEQKVLDEILKQQEKGAVVEEVDEEAAALAATLAAYSGVWVFVEQTEGEPHKVSWELLGKGRELADTLGVELAAVVVGDSVAPLCD